MGHFEITGRHLVKHRSEEGEVISADESHLNVRPLGCRPIEVPPASTPANPPPKMTTWPFCQTSLSFHPPCVLPQAWKNSCCTQASDRPGDRQFILPVIRAVSTAWPLA